MYITYFSHGGGVGRGAYAPYAPCMSTPLLQTTAEHDDVWFILCTIERYSREISRADRCLFGLSSWLSTRSSTATRRMRGLPLPGCQTIVSVSQILLNTLSMLPTFQPLSGNSLSASFVHHTDLTDRDFKSESHASFYEMFMILFNFYRY